MGVTRQVVKQDTPRFYGDATFNNNLAIKCKDSGGTARSILGLGSDNLTRIGAQAAPTSGGDLLFYANGAEAGRFTSAGVLQTGTANAATALEIAGTHATAAMTVAAGSGPIVIGRTTPGFASAQLDVFKSGSSDPVVNIQGSAGTDSMTIRLGNGSGSGVWFITGAAGGFLTGTAQADMGFKVNTTGKAFHIGGTLSVIRVGQDNTLEFRNGSTVLGSMTTGGLFTFSQVKITTSPTNGYVLTTDATGAASWQPPAPAITQSKWGSD